MADVFIGFNGGQYTRTYTASEISVAASNKELPAGYIVYGTQSRDWYAYRRAAGAIWVAASDAEITPEMKMQLLLVT